MLPYELSNYAITLGAPNDLNGIPLAIPFPDRVRIQTVILSGPANKSLVFYNRSTRQAPINISRIVPTPFNKIRLMLPAPLFVRKNDPVTISGCAVVAYNATHVVTDVSSDLRTVDLAASFTQEATSGQVEFNLSSAERAQYQLFAGYSDPPGISTDGTGVGRRFCSPIELFTNQDPANIVQGKRFLYVAGDAGNWRITLRAAHPESQGH